MWIWSTAKHWQHCQWTKLTKNTRKSHTLRTQPTLGGRENFYSSQTKSKEILWVLREKIAYHGRVDWAQLSGGSQRSWPFGFGATSRSTRWGRADGGCLGTFLVLVIAIYKYVSVGFAGPWCQFDFCRLFAFALLAKQFCCGGSLLGKKGRAWTEIANAT